MRPSERSGTSAVSTDMTGWVVLVLVAIGFALTFSFSLLAGALAYYLIHLGRDRARMAEDGAPLPELRAPPPDREHTDEEILDLIERAQRQPQNDTLLWAEQKRADNWSDEQIQAFLDDRPTLDLN